MTTLITGATGLVGGHIARELHEAGEKLRLLVRDRSSRAGLQGLPFEEARGDVRDLKSLRHAVKGIDRVVHAAGVTRVDPFAAEHLRRVHIEGTRNVLTAARDAGVKRLLHVSSTAAVGAGTLDRPADEASTWNLGHKGPYWQTKHASEQLVLDAARSGELDAVVINPSYVLGPYDVKPSSGAVLLAVASGVVLAYPQGGLGFVGARDVGRGARLALEKGRTGERYILSAENLTFRQLLEMAARECGAHAPILPLPKNLALGVARVGDVLGPRFPKAFSYLNTELIRALFDLGYVSGEKARRELGFSPRPVREAICEAYQWFDEAGMLRSWPWKRLLAVGAPQRV